MCSGCGKLDTDSGRNRPHEHRAWYRYRTSATENTSTVALSRALRTQGLLVRLPHAITLGDGSDNHEALMHDVVPGGTGYLADLADPDQLRELLTLAWERVRSCACRYEERLACHRCLLPFAPYNSINRTSRASAVRHLARLLGLAEDAESPDGPPCG